MIVSYHPCYETEINLLCAGRDPDADDLAAIKRASAVVLPQGCRKSLYRMARENCPHVFPNYDARFAYPGKTGQARLFAAMDVPHPQTWTFADLAQFRRWQNTVSAVALPLVFKLDWGGEGETVMPVESHHDLTQALNKAQEYETSGQQGFVLQSMVPHANRTLRVVVIGQTLRSYWRIQDNPEIFGTSLSGGARIDHEVDPLIRDHAESLTRQFCRKTHINLAGLDFIVNASALTRDDPQALMLEINYFFGRTGLGGSIPFYGLLQAEIDNWLASLTLGIRTSLSSTLSPETS